MGSLVSVVAEIVMQHVEDRPCNLPSVTNNSSFQNYPHPDDHTIRTIEAEKTSIVTQWPAQRTRLTRQKIINPKKAFINPLALRLDYLRDCLILLDLILALSPLAAKCERGSLKE